MSVPAVSQGPRAQRKQNGCQSALLLEKAAPPSPRPHTASDASSRGRASVQQPESALAWRERSWWGRTRASISLASGQGPRLRHGQVQAREEEAPSRGGWRFPTARTTHRTLGRYLTSLLPDRDARDQNSGYLPSNVHGALPPLTQDPQAQTQRNFREAGPGRRKGKKDGVALTSGRK